MRQTGLFDLFTDLEKVEVEKGFKVLLDQYFSKDFSFLSQPAYSKTTKDKFVFTSASEMNILLATSALMNYTLTRPLIENMLSIFINLSSDNVSLLAALDNNNGDDVAYEKNIRTLYNVFISQIDNKIMAQACVYNIKDLILQRKILNYYHEDEPNQFLDSDTTFLSDFSNDNQDFNGNENAENNDLYFKDIEPKYGDKKMFYNKTKMPESNEIYKLTHFVDDDDFIANLYILEQVDIVDFKSKELIFSPIKQPILDGGISTENPNSYALTVSQKQENTKLTWEYFEKVKHKMNDILKYFSDTTDKNIYTTTIIEMFRKIIVRLSRMNNDISTLILIEISELFFNISLSLIDYGIVSRSDLSKLETLPLTINSFINIYNFDNPEQIANITQILEDLEVVFF
jgi:hypothetical protein